MYVKYPCNTRIRLLFVCQQFAGIITALKIHMSRYAHAALVKLGGYNIILRGEMPIKVDIDEIWVNTMVNAILFLHH